MVPPVQEPEPKVDEVVVLEETRLAPEVHEPEVKSYGANVVVQEPETKDGNVVAKDPLRCLSREAVDVRTTEVNNVNSSISFCHSCFEVEAVSSAWAGCLCRCRL